MFLIFFNNDEVDYDDEIIIMIDNSDNIILPF